MWRQYLVKLSDMQHEKAGGREESVQYLFFIVTAYMTPGSEQLPLHHLARGKKQIWLENLKSGRITRKVMNQLLFIIPMMKRVDQAHLDSQKVVIFPNASEHWRFFQNDFCILASWANWIGILENVSFTSDLFAFHFPSTLNLEPSTPIQN